MSFQGHPFLQPHPWHDPFAAAPLGAERPTWELDAAGPLAPRPEDFEFSEAGRVAYYQAVRSAAWGALAMQQQEQAIAMRDAGQAQREAEAHAAAQRVLHASLLLLLS